MRRLRAAWPQDRTVQMTKPTKADYEQASRWVNRGGSVVDLIAQAIATARDEERAECAKICADLVEQGFMPEFDDVARGHIAAARTIGNAIRARGGAA